MIKALGFGPATIKVVETLFYEVTTCLSINQAKSKEMSLFQIYEARFPFNTYPVSKGNKGSQISSSKYEEINL
jgi:hypothetical protein